MLLERLADFFQFGERLRQLLLEERDRLGGADAGDHVFALRVDEKFPVELFDAIGRVAGKRDSGSGFVTGVAEDHGLDVDGRAPCGGDVVFPAIDDRPVVHPRAENGTDSPFELVPGIRGEALPGAFLHERLEPLDDLLLVLGGEVAVHDVGMVFVVLEFVDDGFERLVVFALALLDPHDHVAIHLDEPAVAIPREALIFRRERERIHGLVVEAEVEDRVHHARHRVPGTGTDGQQQRESLRVAEFRAHDPLHVADPRFDLGLELFRIRALVVVEIRAHFRCDREPRRHREADAGHLREVGPLAPEQRLHLAVSVGFAVSPRVNIFALAGRRRLR